MSQLPIADCRLPIGKCLMDWLAMLVIGLVVTLVYLAGSYNNGFVYDDHEVIETLAPLHSAADAAELFVKPHYLNYLYYRPITRLTFAWQRTVWGDNPRPYHVFNAILAGLVGMAGYLLLRQKRLGLGMLAATLAALWFALHPATSECVYPAASGRESLMPMLFILLATWAYLHDRWPWHVAGMVIFATALLCKEQAAVLPGIFIAIDLLWHANWRRWLWRWLTALAILFGYFVWRHHIFTGRAIHIAVQHHPLQFWASMLYGLQTTIAPYVPLHYEPPFAGWFSWPLTLVAVLVLASLIIGAMRAVSSNRQSAIGNRQSPIFWLTWFVLLQLPTAHIVAEQEAGYSERYVALATLAAAGVAGALLQRIAQRRQLELAATIALLLVTGFGIATYLRGQYYFSEKDFVAQWFKTDPQSTGALCGMGLVYEQSGQTDAAIDLYQQALAIDRHTANALNNLANIYLDQGCFDEAARKLYDLLAVDQSHPEAMVNYAYALGEQAKKDHDPIKIDRARRWLQKALRLRPNYLKAHLLLGLWYRDAGDQTAARAEFQTVLQLDPGNAMARTQLNKLTQ